MNVDLIIETLVEKIKDSYLKQNNKELELISFYKAPSSYTGYYLMVDSILPLNNNCYKVIGSIEKELSTINNNQYFLLAKTSYADEKFNFITSNTVTIIDQQVKQERGFVARVSYTATLLVEPINPPVLNTIKEVEVTINKSNLTIKDTKND